MGDEFLELMSAQLAKAVQLTVRTRRTANVSVTVKSSSCRPGSACRSTTKA
jgi:hypothetical protein